MTTVAVETQRIRPVTYGLALYFLLMATDCFALGAAGSILKFLALIPLGLSLLDIRKMQIRLSAFVVFQVLFWLLSVLSVLYSVSQSRTVSAVVTLTLNTALILVLGSMQQYCEAETKFLLKAMLWGGWLTVILMLLFSDVSLGGRLTLQLGKGHHDQNYINGYILFAFSYHCKAAFLDRKWWHMTGVLFIMTVALLTGSRGGFLAYIVILALFLIWMVVRSKKPGQNLLVLLFVFLALTVFFVTAGNWLPESIAERFSLSFITESGASGRFRIWKFFIQHFSEDNLLRMFFGHGYGTALVVNTLNEKVAHNLYLDNLITLGILGLALQLLSQGYILREQLRLKLPEMAAAFVGMLVLCLSLSLTAYKPIWNLMMLTMILRYREGGAEALKQDYI